MPEQAEASKGQELAGSATIRSSFCLEDQQWQRTFKQALPQDGPDSSSPIAHNSLFLSMRNPLWQVPDLSVDRYDHRRVLLDIGNHLGNPF